MQANNIICMGSARFLNKAWFNDVSIGGSLSTAAITASSITSTGTLSVTGASTLTGHLTVGTYNNTSYQISANSIIVNNWLRTAGDTGWCNESHGGGWYMNDNNYIRTYGKPVMLGHNLYAGSTSYYFNTSGVLTASTVNATTLASTTIKAQDVNVSGRLRATTYDLQVAQNTGGMLTVAPTLRLESSITVNSLSISSGTVTMQVTHSSITSADIGGITWAVGHRVKVSANINGNPSGTLDGTITAINASNHTISISASGGNAANLSTASTNVVKDLAIMVYERKDGSNYYPVGIQINCYDQANDAPAIRIYGGTASTPSAMLGLLTGAGLPQVNSADVTGWGLYTNNGYFAGQLASPTGLLGGFTIDSTSIRTAALTSNADNSIGLSTADFTRTINSTSRSGLRMAVGDKFGMTGDGAIYASSATISGAITATSLTISSGASVSGTIPQANVTNLTTDLANIESRTVEYIVGTQTGTTNVWTGTTTDASLYTGKTILYYLPYAGNSSAATLNLTLSGGGTTGAKNVRWNNTNVTTHYPQYSVIQMTYDGTYWKTAAYDSGNTIEDRITYFANKTGSKGVWAGSLFMEDGSGTYQNLCTASDGTATASNRTTATTKKANTNGFKVNSTVYYTNSSYNASANISGWGVVYSSTTLIDNRYFMNTGTFSTKASATGLTLYAPFYLVGSVNSSDGLFYLDSTWYTQSPTTTGKVYVLVGGIYDVAGSGSSWYYRMVLYEDNPWYVYDGTRLVPYDKYQSDNAAKTATTYITNIDSNKGITVKPSDSSGNDYLQMNSTAIEFYRNNTSVMNLTDSAFRIGTASGKHSTVDSNGLNIWIGAESTASNKVASFGSTITLYKPGTTTAAVTITDSSATFTGVVNADTGRIGGSSGWTIASQQISSGTIGSDGSMHLATKNLAGTVAGKTLTTTAPSWRLTVGSNFGVTNTGTLYAKNASLTSVSLNDSNGIVRAVVDTDGLKSYDTSGNVIATFGSSIILGDDDNTSLHIDSGGVNMYQGGSSNSIALFGGNSIRIGSMDSGYAAISSSGITISAAQNNIFVAQSSGYTQECLVTTNGDFWNGDPVGGETYNSSTQIYTYNDTVTLPDEIKNAANGTSFTLTATVVIPKISIGGAFYIWKVIHDSHIIYSSTSNKAYTYPVLTLSCVKGTNTNTSVTYEVRGHDSSAGFGVVDVTITLQYNATNQSLNLSISNDFSDTSAIHAAKFLRYFLQTASYTTSITQNVDASYYSLGARRLDEGVGTFSVAMGIGTNAGKSSQLVCGTWNVPDTASSSSHPQESSTLFGKYVFMIGNGSASQYSNALTVDWTGNMVIAGRLTQSSDRRLKQHINYLDQDAVEFVRQLKPAHYIKDNEEQLGFYAQDVDQIDPWHSITGLNDNQYYTLDYISIIAPLVTYCHHLEDRIKLLELSQSHIETA